jgi:hypothetical protein
MRGRVCNLQCNRWLVRSLRTNNHTLQSHRRLCSLFATSYDSQELLWRYSNPPPHGVTVGVELRFSYGRQSVDQFVLESGSPFMTRFYPCPFFSDNCFVVLPVGRPLWREKGAVTYRYKYTYSYICISVFPRLSLQLGVYWSWSLYVISLCDTITQSYDVGLRVPIEFDLTSAFLVWHTTSCTLNPNLWRLYL